MRSSALAQGPVVFYRAAVCGWRDMRAVFSWRTWLGAWLVRVVAQVAFFAGIGVVLGSMEAVAFIAVGMAAATAGLSAMQAVATTTWERHLGTFPLLLIMPTSFLWVYAGRSAERLVDGMTTGTVATLLVFAVLGLPLGLQEAAALAALVLAVTVATYAFALLLAVPAVVAPEACNAISNVAFFALLTVSGALLPVAALPPAVRLASATLPMSHGIDGIRAVAAGAWSWGSVGAAGGRELAVGAAWLCATLVAVRLLGRWALRRGAVDY